MCVHSIYSNKNNIKTRYYITVFFLKFLPHPLVRNHTNLISYKSWESLCYELIFRIFNCNIVQNTNMDILLENISERSPCQKPS